MMHKTFNSLNLKSDISHFSLWQDTANIREKLSQLARAK